MSLSPFDDESLRNGVAEYCRDNGILLIAYRPLGGDRVRQLGRHRELARLAAKYGVTNEEIALAWLMSFGDRVVPIPGATRVETASSLARAVKITLDDEDRAALDTQLSGRLLRVSRAERRPRDDAAGEVVIVMGMPGAGKSGVARDLASADTSGSIATRSAARSPTSFRASTNARKRTQTCRARQHVSVAKVAQRGDRVRVAARRPGEVRLAHNRRA